MTPVLLAFVSAVLLALASTLEQDSAQKRPATEALKLPFLARLAREPRWLLGMAFALLSFPMEAAALGMGSLVVVEPILAGGIALAVPMQWVVFGRRPRTRDLFLAALVAAALATFLLAGRLSTGRKDAETLEWVAAGLAAVTFAATLAVFAVPRRGAIRAGTLGIAAGTLFGLQSALIKTTVNSLSAGPLHVLGDWHLYTLVATGATALVLEQSAYQAGALAPAVSGTKLMTAVVAVALGLLLFDERFAASGASLVLAVVALATAFLALMALSRDQAQLELEAGAGGTPREARPESLRLR